MRQMKTFFQWTQKWLMTGVFTQLFLLVGSSPIILWWGLPISVVSIVGNIIFAPVITLFLLACTLLFFTELLDIPNGVLVASIELLCSWWLFFLDQGSRGLLLKFQPPSWWLACGIVASAMGVIYSPWGRNPLRASIVLGILAVGFAYFLW